MTPIIKYTLFFALLLASELLYFRLADKFNIIDKPNQRSSHSYITLRGGGIIFFISIWLWAAFFGFGYMGFMVGLTAIGLVSFIDDVKSLPDWVRLVVQFGAMMLMFEDLGLYTWSDWWRVIPALIVCVGIINAYNFMDGINGITGCYSVAVILPLLYVDRSIGFVEESLLFVTLISVGVFLFFNFRKRARCFAGDVGSVSIAFIILFALGRLIVQTDDLTYLMFLAVYGVDSILTIVHRIMLHENLGEAHRKHAYQLMSNELKMQHRLVSLIYLGLQLVISAGLIALHDYRWVYSISVLAMLVAAYIWFMRSFYHLHAEYLASKSE